MSIGEVKKGDIIEVSVQLIKNEGTLNKTSSSFIPAMLLNSVVLVQK